MSRRAQSSRSLGNVIRLWISLLLGTERHHHRRHRPERIGMWKREETVNIASTESPGPEKNRKQVKHVHSHRRKPGRNFFKRTSDRLSRWVQSAFEPGYRDRETERKPGVNRRRKHRQNFFSRFFHSSKHGLRERGSRPIGMAPPSVSAIKPERAPARVEHRKRRAPSAGQKRLGRFNIWRYLPYEWMAGWENFLYSLYLRSMPHDPFLKREIDNGDRPVSVKMAHELSYFVSSLVVFIAAGLSAWIIYQLSVMLAASFFDIDSVLFYYEVMFPIGNASSLWTPLNIIVITLAGPLLSLLAGLFTYFYLIRKQKARGLNRLFFLWLSFHLFNQFFGGFVAGIITDQGFGYVANWLYFGMAMKILLSLVALSILGFAGYKVVPWLLATAGKPERIRRENRVLFIFTQAVLPWLAGSLILLALRIPNHAPQHANILVYDSIIAGALGVMALAMFFNRFVRPASVAFRKTNYKNGFIWGFSTLAAVLFIRIVLSYGLHIVIHLSMRISFFNS